jgi:hypothetical protein
VEQPFHTVIFVCNCKQQVPGTRVIYFSLRTEAKRRRGGENQRKQWAHKENRDKQKRRTGYTERKQKKRKKSEETKGGTARHRPHPAPR